MPPDANVKPDADTMDDDGELTVEALDRVVGGTHPSNVTTQGSTINNYSPRGRTMNFAAP